MPTGRPAPSRLLSRRMAAAPSSSARTGRTTPPRFSGSPSSTSSSDAQSRDGPGGRGAVPLRDRRPTGAGPPRTSHLSRRSLFCISLKNNEFLARFPRHATCAGIIAEAFHTGGPVMEAPRSSEWPRGQAVPPHARGDPALEQALTKAGDGAFAVAEDGRVRLWNQAAERILGWTASEVLERPCCEILEGIDGNDNHLCSRGCHLISLVQRREFMQLVEVQTHTKAGRPVWLDIRVLEVSPAGGDDVLTVLLF